LTSNIFSAVRYWFGATLRPKRVIAELKVKPNKVAIALWINIIFAALYSITALTCYAIGHLPSIPPWIPIAVEKYYLYQTLWTVPWGLAMWMVFFGVAHLLAVAGKESPSSYQYEDALVVCGLAWVVPNAILMWMPEAILLPIFGMFWPAWLETLRLIVLPPIWQSILIATGLQETHEIGWARGIGIGVVTVPVFFISLLAYLR